MAKFEVLEQEGMNFVKIDIENEMVRAESGALCWMTGGIEPGAIVEADGIDHQRVALPVSDCIAEVRGVGEIGRASCRERV